MEIEEPSDGETAWSLCIVVDRLLCCNMRMNPNIDFNTYLPCPSLKGYRLLDPDMFLNNYSSHSGITHGKVESYLILTEILYELTQLEKNLNPNLEASKILKNLIEGQTLIDKLEKFGQSYWIIKDIYRRPNLTNIDDYFITRIDITLLFHCITLQVSRHLSIIYDQLAKSIKLNLSIKEIHYDSSPIFQSKVMSYSNNNNNSNSNNQLPKFDYEDVLKFDLNSKQCFKGSIASAEWILHFVKTVELTCSPSYKPTSKRKDKHQLNINHNLYKGVYYISLCFAMGLNHARTVFLTTNSSEYKEKIEYCQSRLTTLAKIWPMVEYFMKNETQCVQDTSSFEDSMSTSTSSKSPISSDCS
ncbi:hypothetical protein K502DRAFT_252082 [Neoconidiobolus thromboides FSU 785]|nr:hypothetical protein K502DRAFT_252082 [Neoconidiobolus thromboides FSU 785]